MSSNHLGMFDDGIGLNYLSCIDGESSDYEVTQAFHINLRNFRGQNDGFQS